MHFVGLSVVSWLSTMHGMNNIQKCLVLGLFNDVFEC